MKLLEITILEFNFHCSMHNASIFVNKSSLHHASFIYITWYMMHGTMKIKFINAKQAKILQQAGLLKKKRNYKN